MFHGKLFVITRGYSRYWSNHQNGDIGWYIYINISGSMIRLEVNMTKAYIFEQWQKPPVDWLFLWRYILCFRYWGLSQSMSWEIPIKKPRDEGTTGDGTNTVHNYVCLTKKNVWDILLCPSKLIAVHVLVAFVCDIFWLVVWNMTFIFPYLGNVNSNSNWRTHIFQRGRAQPPTRKTMGHRYPQMLDDVNV